MDGFTFNKIAGAALSALLFIFGAKTITEISHSAHKPTKAGFELPKPVDTSKPAEAAKPFAAARILALLPKATAEDGADIFRKCAACHTPAKGGKNGTGPNLYGVVGRKVAAVGDFTYTPAMKGKGGDWGWEQLAVYLYDPKATVPNTSMNFDGVKEDGDLAALLVYLRSLADSPVALPK